MKGITHDNLFAYKRRNDIWMPGILKTVNPSHCLDDLKGVAEVSSQLTGCLPCMFQVRNQHQGHEQYEEAACLTGICR